jgi:hypothetical protein
MEYRDQSIRLRACETWEGHDTVAHQQEHCSTAEREPNDQPGRAVREHLLKMLQKLEPKARV